MPTLRPSFFITLALGLAGGIWFNQVQPIQAAATSGNVITLSAIPPRVGETGEIKIQPGQKFQATVQVANTSNTEIAIDTFVKDFIIAPNGEDPVQVQESVENRWSLAAWVTVTPAHQVIPIKKIATVNVLIEVPKDARPGGHYAMILHKPSLIKTASGFSGTGINQQVGSLLYVTVEGPIDELAFIRSFSFRPAVTQFGPVHFAYSLDNQSDVHLRPAGTVEIYNLFRQKVATLPVETNNVFPGSQRAFSGDWPIKWGFGPYTAVLTVSYGTRGQVLTAHTTVWLLPLPIVVAILIAIFTLIIGSRILKHRHKHRPK